MRFKTSMLFVVIMASFSTSAQTGDPMSLGSYPVENLVVRVPTGMTIHYSPKIMLEAGNALPSASVGSPYSFDFKTKATIINDDAPDMSLATWSLLTPGPSGLNLSPSGILSGTPIGDGSYTFEVMVTYKTSTDTQVYVMKVTLDVVVALADATPPPGVVGQTYAGFDPRSLVQVSGDPSFNVDAVTWSIKSGSTLPAGLSLNTNTGLVFGTPSASFSGPVTLVATYKGESGERTYEFTVDLNIGVSLATGTPVQGVVGQVYGGFDPRPLLTVTGDPDFQMSAVTWSVTSGTLPAGLSLDDATGQVSGMPSAGASNTVTLRASYKDKNGTRSYSFVVLDIKVALASAVPPVGVVNAAYSFDPKSLLSVTGDPAYVASSVTWSLKSGSTLPVGLSLNPSTGVISGTPTQTHSGPATLVATYRGVNGEQAYSFNVNFDIVVSLAAATPPEAVVGVPYSGFNLQSLLSVTGDPDYSINAVTWSLASGALPAGLTLDEESGSISGTPTTAGVSSATFRATYTNASGTQIYNFLTINVGVALAAATPPAGLVGTAYPGFDLKNYLTISGDPSPSVASVAWSVVSGALPAGLTLNAATGVISGTPTEAANNPVVFRASYKGKMGEQTYTIKADFNIVMTLAAATLPAATVNQAYEGFDFNALLSVTGDPDYRSDQVSWKVKESSALPDGMILSQNGNLSGTPTIINESGMPFEVIGEYKDATGQQIYTIVVNGMALQVTQISAGYDHTCAMTAEGAVKCWGGGAYGQLGNGITTDSYTPVSVIGLGSNVTQISAGYHYTCAVHAGAVKCWGWGFEGRLGNGGTTDSATPVSVIGLNSGVTKISAAAGGGHACAIHDGAAKCWGRNGNGQLGNGGTTISTTPVNVNGLDSGVTQIATGGVHTCAVHEGAMKCWGYGMHGQLGNGSTTQRTTPVNVTGLGSNVTQISVGTGHTCAVHAGAAKCWGHGGNGRLGNGGTTNSSTPVSVIGLGSGVTQISAGGVHTCAVHNGAAKCWGFGSQGRLGNGGTTDSTTPVNVTGLTSGINQITGGTGHSCVAHNGAAKCWGNGANGQLGNGSTTNSTTPADVLP